MNRWAKNVGPVPQWDFHGNTNEGVYLCLVPVGTVGGGRYKFCQNLTSVKPLDAVPMIQ